MGKSWGEDTCFLGCGEPGARVGASDRYAYSLRHFQEQGFPVDDEGRVLVKSKLRQFSTAKVLCNAHRPDYSKMKMSILPKPSTPAPQAAPWKLTHWQASPHTVATDYGKACFNELPCSRRPRQWTNQRRREPNPFRRRWRLLLLLLLWLDVHQLAARARPAPLSCSEPPEREFEFP